jgi:hypothetical protein
LAKIAENRDHNIDSSVASLAKKSPSGAIFRKILTKKLPGANSYDRELQRQCSKNLHCHE